MSEEKRLGNADQSWRRSTTQPEDGAEAARSALTAQRWCAPAAPHGPAMAPGQRGGRA